MTKRAQQLMSKYCLTLLSNSGENFNFSQAEKYAVSDFVRFLINELITSDDFDTKSADKLWFAKESLKIADEIENL